MPVGWEHLTVATLGLAPSGELAPRQEGSLQHGKGAAAQQGSGLCPTPGCCLVPAPVHTLMALGGGLGG